MNLEQTLKDFGLTEKQAKVYLACLELGSASVQKISRKSGLPRSTCYELLERLCQQGFASTYKKKNIQYYGAEDPQKVIVLAKDKVELLEQAFPELRALYGAAKHRPTVRFYQGTLGMKLILEEILAEAREVRSFGAAEDLFTTLDKIFPEFVKKRVQKKISVQVILRESPKARERQQLGPQHLRVVKIIPESYRYHGNIFIWGNKIAMFSFRKDLVALVVESDELTQVQTAMFDALWNTLPQR
ncbi:MAG: transcriptional regulator TrmB [Parcubacteria group bacterium Gr01-1014_31]|nr:MAG: transcriptional regulator TrmB [Parcubacteria group bacterium Gr01-1014_31]